MVLVGPNPKVILLRHARGFTLVEILAAMAVVGMVMAVGIPQSVKFYESMQFRSAVRESITLLKSARHKAIESGVLQDVRVIPDEHIVTFGRHETSFEENVELTVNSAKSLSSGGSGLIRFYPDGSASGGGLSIKRESDERVSIAVDWLVGRVTVSFADDEDEV